MSHSSKDKVRGHVSACITFPDGWKEPCSTGARLFSKKYRRREARREARAIVETAVAQFYDDQEIDKQEMADWEDYEGYWYDEYLEEVRLEYLELEPDPRDYDDPYKYDMAWIDY